MESIKKVNMFVPVKGIRQKVNIFVGLTDSIKKCAC